MEFVEKNGIGYFRSEKFQKHNIAHGFTTKKIENIEEMVFPSKPFMLKEEIILEFAKRLGLENKRFVFQEQVHSDNIKIISEDDVSQDRITIIPQNDGLLTSLKDICLVSLSADCLSVLLAHPETGTIANAHAGRRGAMLGIIPKLVFTFCMEYGILPGEVLVGLGTSIAAMCYEVKEDVIEEMKNNDPDALGFLISRMGRRFFDLRGYVFRSLTLACINPDNMDSQLMCSHCNEDLFYSYRRDGRVIGSQAAFIST